MNIIESIKKAKKDNVVLLTTDKKTASELKHDLTIKAEYSSGRCFTLENKNISVISLLEDPFAEVLEYSLVYVNWKSYKKDKETEDRLIKWEKGAKQIIRN